MSKPVVPEQPIVPKARDGIYPRCVWCLGENYALAVIAYSAGEVPCAAVNGCGKYLPADYVLDEEAAEEDPPPFVFRADDGREWRSDA